MSYFACHICGQYKGMIGMVWHPCACPVQNQNKLSAPLPSSEGTTLKESIKGSLRGDPSKPLQGAVTQTGWASEGTVKSPDRCPRCGSLEKPFLSLGCASVNENSHPWHHEFYVADKNLVTIEQFKGMGKHCALKSETAKKDIFTNFIDLYEQAEKSETVPTEAAKEETPPMNESEGFPECDCGVGTKHFNFFCHTLKCAYRSAVAASWKKINTEIKAELVVTPSPMDPESETVEERAKPWKEFKLELAERDVFETWALGYYFPSPETMLAERDEAGQYLHPVIVDAWEAWQARAALASSLQDKSLDKSSDKSEVSCNPDNDLRWTNGETIRERAQQFLIKRFKTKAGGFGMSREAAIEILAAFASSLLQEKERERNALVTLLRAKCSDSEWAEMGEKFDGLTSSTLAEKEQRIKELEAEVE